MLDLDHVEALILRPPSSSFDREMLLELVRECRRAQKELGHWRKHGRPCALDWAHEGPCDQLSSSAKALLASMPQVSPMPEVLVAAVPQSVITELERTAPAPTPPEKPKAKGRR